MAIKFGGRSTGYRINRPSFDTKTFDCGSDYRLFINRIDKICTESKQLNDAICYLKERADELKTYTGGDCVQRITVTATEIAYNPIMEAVHPCADITSLVETDSLLMASDGTCNPGIKALEINIAFSGYGDGTSFLNDPSGAAAVIGDFSSVVDSTLIDIINLISFQIIQDYGYDAPIDDFHTFNVTIRGIKKADTDERIPIGACTADSNFYSTRWTYNIDVVNGIVREEREVTFQGEYASSTDAATGFSTECN